VNPQVLYHAYAMSYLELESARSEGRPVPPSVLARLTAPRAEPRRAVLRALKDIEVFRPMRSKEELLEALQEASDPAMG
jgi:hypothetical protein